MPHITKKWNWMLFCMSQNSSIKKLKKQFQQFRLTSGNRAHILWKQKEAGCHSYAARRPFKHMASARKKRSNCDGRIVAMQTLKLLPTSIQRVHISVCFTETAAHVLSNTREPRCRINGKVG
uniref:Uncharacterized protein n=1 Tax=Eutreptiella gymnastica TaxID=73025 RepID=A0A6U8NFE5_9EUGL|mmetsp:Transcript_88654/g.153886  ORF Transcript_88654/g.153886 Transcript_88654/m.153886 type:complete len:122 (+) Transcript_88654:756-1121(+)